MATRGTFSPGVLSAIVHADANFQPSHRANPTASIPRPPARLPIIVAIAAPPCEEVEEAIPEFDAALPVAPMVMELDEDDAEEPLLEPTQEAVNVDDWL